MSSLVIRSITPVQQQKIIERTNYYIQQAAEYFSGDIKTIEIKFNLSGKTAGMFCVKKEQFNEPVLSIRYNPWIFSKYYQVNLTTTVPHEVAHYIVWLLHVKGKKLNNRFLKKRSSIKPHGQEWKQVMAVFEADDSVTCDFDFAGVPCRQQQRFSYACQCRTHELSSTVHNRIQKKSYQYLCKSCQTELKKAV